MEKGLGRRVPSDFSHVSRHPFGALNEPTIAVVEKTLVLPSWHTKHDQGREGACVGFGTSMMLSILNEHQVRRQGQLNPYIRYNPFWLWNQAKAIDEWPDTQPGDSHGTSVKAAVEILVTKGHALWHPQEDDPDSFSEPEADYGISNVRWAQTVDEMRTSIAMNKPITIGINWYSKFAEPQYINGEFWIGRDEFGVMDGERLGIVTGGHSTCFYGASDERQAFRQKNSWGPNYPEVWVPYTVVDRVRRENGEFAIVVDR